MEQIAVFGASGATGQALVREALSRAVGVRALVRPGSRAQGPSPGFDPVTGALTSVEDVGRALEGVQGVACVFGPRREKPEPFCAQATRTVVDAMRAAHVDRLVCQTGAMIGTDLTPLSGSMRRMASSYRRRAPELAADRDEQERVVRESGLDWTLVKPPRLKGGPAVGAVRAAASMRVGLLSSVRREDLAKFLLDELANGRFHRQAVYVVG